MNNLQYSSKRNIFALNMEKQRGTWLQGRAKYFIHVLIWCIVFAMPVIFAQRDGVFQWKDMLKFMPVALSFLIVFYANYSLFVDKYLLKRENSRFFIINVVMIVGIAILLYVWHRIEHAILYPDLQSISPPQGPKIPVIFFILRDISSLTFVAVLGIVMKSTERISQIQLKQRELEGAMVEAELKNLKNQINPHFLLNTLNNIYALSQMNSPKTSSSIMELSELLRYMLYENEKTFVSLKDEANFISNYIDLMKLRMTENVKVTTNIHINDNSRLLIAPFIYISLIENAFKHGVSNDEPSFVEIELEEKVDGRIHFLCRNSYFPKDVSDRSGSGIGLQQVQKRLNLLYPYRYMWHKEMKDNVYSVVLVINTLDKTDEHEQNS